MGAAGKVASGPAAVGEGLQGYYRAKIEELEVQCKDRAHNLRRLEAQRNELNMKGVPGEEGRDRRARRAEASFAAGGRAGFHV